MQIDGIQIFRVAMPLLYPFRTAFDDTSTVESVLVQMTSEGVSGWGEASPWGGPFYSGEWAAGAFLLLRDWLGPRLLHQDICSGDDLQRMLAPFKGNPFAKASLDLAWWDLHSKRAGKPLWQMLGGVGPLVEVGADFGVMENVDLLLSTIHDAVEGGYKRVKLKFRPGWDLEMVRAVRSTFPNQVFHIDCNSAYRLLNASLFEELDQFNLAMIEQPLAHDDLLDHSRLQSKIRTLICLDESITSLEKTEKAIECGACGWINIKPGRVGGITPSLEILHAAEARGIPCWIGGMLESSIGASACIALATLTNIKYPSDIFPTSRFYDRDLGNRPIELAGPSTVRAFEGSGIGCEPDSEQLRKLTIESHVVECRLP